MEQNVFISFNNSFPLPVLTCAKVNKSINTNQFHDLLQQVRADYRDESVAAGM